MEIEKKFLVKSLPLDLAQYKKKEIEQGYLASKPIVRIRRSNADYYLTYKAKINKDNDVIINNEVELPLTREAYEHLKNKIDNNLIIKTRYLIPLVCGLMGELDVFHGKLDGLYFIEVEFKSEEQAAGFQKPEWFGENVSADGRYTNRYLSELENLRNF